MSVTSIIVIIGVVAVIIWKKSKKSSPSATTSGYESEYIEDSSDGEVDTYDFSSNPVLKKGLDRLKSVVTPNKHGEFNDAKKIGKTIASINEEVSAVLPAGSEAYVEYFESLYRNVIVYMLNSSNRMQAEATAYTLEQQAAWEKTGKSQTFVKGLSEDSLVAKAEVIMAVCEKCWFGNIKTTMFRKHMEKYNLPRCE